MARTLSKPPGLPVFPPHAAPGGDCLLRRLLLDDPRRAELPWPEGFAGGIAHRLDVATSGAIWVADDPAELGRMRARFAEGRLTKTYRLLAARDVPWDHNACERPLAHAPRHKGRMVVQRGASTPHRGRWYPAVTRFRRLRGRLFEAVMHTGVMHQVRAHAAFVGIPIAGDGRYGGGEPPADSTHTLHLHHVGLMDEEGWGTEPVALPPWARS